MSFQQRPQRRTPRCPWCDQEMVPSPDSRGGRLYCPTGEAVEYRLSGGRWYFNGRLNGLDEPIPPAPDDGPSPEHGGPVFRAPTDPPHPPTPSSSSPVPSVPSIPSVPLAPSVPPTSPTLPEPLDALDAFRRIASDAWGAEDADRAADA